MDLTTAIENFMFHCEFEKHLSQKTIKAYQLDLKQFLTFIHQHKGSVPIERIDKQLLRDYFKKLKDRAKSKTVKRKLATLKAMFTFLDFEDIIVTNPFRKIRLQIREPLKLPTVMTLEEVRQMLDKSYLTAHSIADKDSFAYCAAIRDIAVLELLFATGIRVSECCCLQEQDIDLFQGSIQVNGKGDKQRIIQVCHAETLRALISYQTLRHQHQASSPFFFINRSGQRLSEQSVRFMIKRYATEARLSRNITPHVFRHTFATMLLEEGVDIKYIQHLLGHSSIMTTQIYTHVNKKKQEQILATNHPRRLFSMG